MAAGTVLDAGGSTEALTAVADSEAAAPAVLPEAAKSKQSFTAKLTSFGRGASRSGVQTPSASGSNKGSVQSNR